ncbi:MAG TPA: cytochrome c [Ferruginibacter sp.]|nr:cytochrome c [Ferruginibacter sp.]
MKKLVLIISLIMIIISCSHKTIPTTAIVIPKPDSPEAMAGKEVFTAKCGTCHGLKDPADHTAQEWVPIVKEMGKKAKLNDTDKKNVLAYVQSNARQD